MNCQPSLQQRLVDPPNAVALERKAEVDARAQGLQKALPEVLPLLQSVPDEVARMAHTIWRAGIGSTRCSLRKLAHTMSSREKYRRENSAKLFPHRQFRCPLPVPRLYHNVALRTNSWGGAGEGIQLRIDRFGRNGQRRQLRSKLLSLSCLD